MAGKEKTEHDLEKSKEALSQLHSATKFRMHEMAAHLTRPLPNAEDTTTFEVLADEED